MFRAPLLFLFLLALALRGNAQPLPDRRELSGRVASTKSVPVGGAQIQIRRKETKASAVFWGVAVLSNVAGDWRVPDAEDGDYVITVTAPGYETWSAPYTLREYEPSLRITLQRKVSLTFTILDPNGQPVQGKTAAVFGYVTKAGIWQLGNQPGVALGTTSLTSSSGQCTLPNGSEGVYHELYVAVRGVGHMRWMGKVEILEGGTQHFDLQLQKATAALQVKIVEESPNPKEAGRSLGAAQIYPQSVQPLQISDKTLALWLFRQNDLTSTDGTGIVRLIGLLPGRYQIRVTTPFNCNLAKFAEVVQAIDVVPDEEKEVAFRIPPCSTNTPTLQVTIKDEHQVPLANREVRLFCQPISETTQMNLQFEEAAARRVPFSSMRRGTTDAAGKITLYPFWAGLWRISVYEVEARIPFHGAETVDVTPEGGQITIATALNPAIEE